MTFAPSLADGVETGTLTLSYNGGLASAGLLGNATGATLSAPKVVALKGAAAGDTGPTKTIKVVNHSKVTITTVSTPALTDFKIINDDCLAMNISPGQSCTFEVETKPGPGRHTGDILNEQLNYPFTYGYNHGNVSITLKSNVL